jgi:hypothetical protein|nr:MAG TPA: hypothetical protein [Caudoviricetes sp.]
MVRIYKRINAVTEDMRTRFGKEMIDGNITQDDFNSVIAALEVLKEVSAKAESEVDKNANILKDSNLKNS